MSVLRLMAKKHRVGQIAPNWLVYLADGPHKGKYALQFILPLRWKDYDWCRQDMVWGDLTVRIAPYKPWLEVFWNPDFVDTWDLTA